MCPRALGDALLYSRIITFSFGRKVAIGFAFFDEFVGSGAMFIRIRRLKDDLFVVTLVPTTRGLQ